MTGGKYRVLVVASHPTQYSVPVFRRMVRDPHIDLQVAYCSLQGAKPGYDPGFDREIAWDIPLLDGYRWLELPNRSFRPGLRRFWGLVNPGVWKLLREGRYDATVIYTGYVYATFWMAVLAARASGTAVLFGTDASSMDPRDGRGWKLPVKRLLWPRLFGMADQVLTPSAAGFELMRSLGLPEDRIVLTPFAADNDWWTARAARAHRGVVRESWGVADGEVVLLFCAKLQPWKRPQDVLRAFARAGVPDCVLVFAGEGPLRPALEKEAAALGVSHRVRFLGFVNQSRLPETYAASDLFVLPSDYDPCPVVVCEAMLCGLPVVLSDRIRGRFDLVRSGVTGEIFPCGDVDALAGTFRALLADRARLAAMSTNARARMSTWSPQENADAVAEAVARAVSRRRGHSGARAGVRAPTKSE